MADDLVALVRRECNCQFVSWKECPCLACRAADEIERLRTAGQGLYDVLDQMWKCGLRRDNVARAMDIWDGIPVAVIPKEAAP